ncbi:hypothetical protein [Gordonia soli]|uniref:DUF4829 domain-containing protein n=1 Tax=Gordonia soli NBRC 108243 TaxID=1223545 RepID=M0QGX1_9ACTN|nr:hypothetical protein [Gordonia soli]GAC67556.1 hypothetical protein GS4_08_01410 [Gordonia soli NBRC 108243]
MTTPPPSRRRRGRTIALVAAILILVAAVITLLITHFVRADNSNTAERDLESAVQQAVQQLHDNNRDALLASTCGQPRLLVENNTFDPLNTTPGYTQNLWRGAVTAATDFGYHTILDDTAVVYGHLEYTDRADESMPWPVVRFSLQRNSATEPWQLCGAQTTL